MRTLSDKVIQPLLSEKSSTQESRYNEYSLVVDKSMTKPEIYQAIEKLFGVRPEKVRTVNFRKKSRRTQYGIVPAKTYKKALVRLPEGKRIELK